MINHQFDSSSPWQHIPVEMKLPVMLDVTLGLGSAFEILAIDDTEYSLLKAALQAKVFILAEHLKTMTSKLDLQIPRFPNGSGARGSVVKEDHARALVRFLFPGFSVAEQEELVKSLAPPPRKKKQAPKAEDMDEDSQVLGMIAQLDPENAAAFSKMSLFAKEKLAESYRFEGAEEIKAHVRAALEKEDMEIDFQEGGNIKVKRRRMTDSANVDQSTEKDDTREACLRTNKGYYD